MKKTEGFKQFEKEWEAMNDNKSFPDPTQKYTFQDMRCASERATFEAAIPVLVLIIGVMLIVIFVH